MPRFVQAFHSTISSPDSLAISENKTSTQAQVAQTTTTTTNASKMNIVLVHGAWADGSSWDKVIPILSE